MNRFVIVMLVGLLVALGATATVAQTVTSNVEGNDGGVFTSDPQGPSGSAVSSALSFAGAATLDFSGTGFGKADQRPDGVGAVLTDALFANGQTGNYVESRTKWTETVTNSTGTSTNYTFDFFITPPSLRIGDYAGLEDTDPSRPDVSYLVTIRANGVTVFESGANLIGGSVSHVLNETGISLGPSAVGSGSVFGYNFLPYADALTLGPVAAGGTLTVEYEMVVRVDTPGFEAGGRAQIGDPFDLDGAPGFSGTLSPGGPVPTEETTWGRVKSLYR